MSLSLHIFHMNLLVNYWQLLAVNLHIWSRQAARHRINSDVRKLLSPLTLYESSNIRVQNRSRTDWSSSKCSPAPYLNLKRRVTAGWWKCRYVYYFILPGIREINKTFFHPPTRRLSHTFISMQVTHCILPEKCNISSHWELAFPIKSTQLALELT